MKKMPYNYKKKTPGRNLVPEDKVIAAKMLIEQGKSKHATDFVGIHDITLRKKLKMGYVPKALGWFKPTFTKKPETEFANYCKAMDERFLACDFAMVNRIVHRFDNSSRMAGRDWVECFLKRHEYFGLRQSTPVSLARGQGFNKAQIEKFYQNLKHLYEQYKFKPHRIMDETGMSMVPKKSSKVIATKGKKVVGKIVSAERGMAITAVMYMSATGHYVPQHGPTRSICMISDSGFINTDLFVNWLHHFKYFVHPTQEHPVRLILNNHSSHISLERLPYAKEDYIVRLTIPLHGSLKIQFLDVAVYCSLRNDLFDETDYAP